MKKLILILIVLTVGCVRMPITRELYEPQVGADGQYATYECMRLKEPVVVFYSFNGRIDYPIQDLKLHATTSAYRYYIAQIHNACPYGGGLAINVDTKKIRNWCNGYGLLGKLPIFSPFQKPINVEYEIVFIQEKL